MVILRMAWFPSASPMNLEERLELRKMIMDNKLKKKDRKEDG